jgi:hypothetical protein
VYSLAVVASLYTTYSAAFTLLAYQVVAAWWWLTTRRLDFKKWLLCHVLVLLAYAPWGIVEWGHGATESISISGRDSISSLIWTLHRFITGPLPPHAPLLKGVIMVLALIAAVGVVRGLRGAGEKRLALSELMGAALIPLCLGAIVQVRGAPMIATLRLFIGVVVPALLCVAAGVMYLQPRWRWTIVGALLSLNLVSLNKWMLPEYPYVVGWQQVTAHIVSSSSGSSTLVVAVPDLDAYVFEYYLRGHGKPITTFPYGGPGDLDAVRQAIHGKSEVWLSTRHEADDALLRGYLHEKLAFKYAFKFSDSRLEKFEPR